jgi:hypothetical protein
MDETTTPLLEASAPSRLYQVLDAIVKYGIPILALLVALGSLYNQSQQNANTKAIRFDAFNLEMLKLRITPALI